MWTVSADPTLPPRVAELLESVQQWDAARWRTALQAARLPLHRERRAISRPLCDAILAVQREELRSWLVRDAVRTALECRPHVQRRVAAKALTDTMTELLEDGALAMLARPALPLGDLAVLLGPCLPLIAG